MEAEQILELSNRYSNESMAELPQDIKNLKSSSNIRKKGFLHEDRVAIGMSREHNESSKRGSKRKIASISDHETQAASMEVDNDKTFVPKTTEELDREKKMKAIASISFWDPGMSASMVKEKLPQTMPLFWKDEMVGYPRYKLKPLLKDFLQKVKDISKGKIANTLTNVAILSSNYIMRIWLCSSILVMTTLRSCILTLKRGKLNIESVEKQYGVHLDNQLWIEIGTSSMIQRLMLVMSMILMILRILIILMILIMRR